MKRDKKAHVRFMLKFDRRITVREIVESLNVSVRTVYNVLKDDLKIKQSLCAVDPKALYRWSDDSPF